MTHEIIEGDCLEVMPTLASASFDAIIVDCPYGTTACKWDTVIPFAPMWEQVKRLVKPRAAIVMFASQPFTSALVMSNPAWFRHEWIWQKNCGSNFATVGFAPFKEHESVLVFGESGCAYYPQMQERLGDGKDRALRPNATGEYQHEAYGISGTNPRKWRTELRVPSSVQKFNRERGFHPTQKPVALMEYLVRTYTNEGDTVLDFCAGSGSTGVACLNTGRHFIGIEKEPAYAEIARRRLTDAAAQPRLEMPA